MDDISLYNAQWFTSKVQKKKTSSHDLGKEILELKKKSHDKISNAYIWCSSNIHPYPMKLMNQLAT